MTVEIKPISKLRFEALAGYCRMPNTWLLSEEVEWHEAQNETILIAIVRDHTDGDYAALLLGRDLKERYRWVGMTEFYETVKEALENVQPVIDRVMADFESARKQGDEKGKPVDFFTPIVPDEKLNQDLKTVMSLVGYSPALEIVKPMMRWYQDPDGNFIQQFQTTGFDTRLWEIYLFAMLTEVPFAIERKFAVPDFSATGPFGELFIEATSVNPSAEEHLAPPPMETAEQRYEFLRNYMPIRFAGPLVNKLKHESKKLRYWEHEHVKGKPLVFAIQDFHAPGSMTYSSAALPIYLYGTDWRQETDAAGKSVTVTEKIEKHVWGTKEIESGFFNLPDSENISAVIINPSATISKFNRMGLIAGFGEPGVRMVRTGFFASPENVSGKPTPFMHNVNAADYRETWMEGLSVYHNPLAKVPLKPILLPGAAHHFLAQNGVLQTQLPNWYPVASKTQIFMNE